MGDECEQRLLASCSLCVSAQVGVILPLCCICTLLQSRAAVFCKTGPLAFCMEAKLLHSNAQTSLHAPDAKALPLLVPLGGFDEGAKSRASQAGKPSQNRDAGGAS